MRSSSEYRCPTSRRSSSRSAAAPPTLRWPPRGEYVRAKLAGFGVDTSFVDSDPRYRTPLAFGVMDPPDDPQIIFYREPSAPDEHVALTERHLDGARTVDIFWVAGSCLSG